MNTLIPSQLSVKKIVTSQKNYIVIIIKYLRSKNIKYRTAALLAQFGAAYISRRTKIAGLHFVHITDQIYFRIGPTRIAALRIF